MTSKYLLISHAMYAWLLLINKPITGQVFTNAGVHQLYLHVRMYHADFIHKRDTKP